MSISTITSMADIVARLKANPVKAARVWHKRVRNSYRAGQPCDYCGRTAWEVVRVVAECGGCGNALLVERKVR